MKKHTKPALWVMLGIIIGFSSAYFVKAVTTVPITTSYRDLEMKVNVAGNDILIWKRTLPPAYHDKPGIDIHRHEYPRIIIPLTNGKMLRRYDDGQVFEYNLQIGKPIFVPEDTPTGFHTDENLGDTAIQSIIIQFTQTPVNVEQLTPQDLQAVIFK